MTHLTGLFGKVGTGLIVVTALWLFFRFFEWRSMYYPGRHIAFTPADAGLVYEDVSFLAEDDARLHGWWIAADHAPGTLIVCHGNAGNMGDRVGLAADLHRLGLNLFMFDYRGYGRSRGIPTEKGTYKDARAAFEVVRSRYQDTETPPIAVFGRSLGGGVAVQLALDRPVRALVVENTFTSTMDMARHLYPWLPTSLCRFRYDSLSKVGRLRVPKLFAHALHDEVVPFSLGEALFARAAEPKAMVQLRGGHNDTGWATTPGYWETLSRFLAEHLAEPTTPVRLRNHEPEQ